MKCKIEKNKRIVGRSKNGTKKNEAKGELRHTKPNALLTFLLVFIQSFIRTFILIFSISISMSSSNTTNICMHACYFALWCVRVCTFSFREMNENRKRKWPKRQRNAGIVCMISTTSISCTLHASWQAVHCDIVTTAFHIQRIQMYFGLFFSFFLYIVWSLTLCPPPLSISHSHEATSAYVSISFTTQSSWLFESKSQLNFDYPNLICLFSLSSTIEWKKKIPKRNQ